MLLKRVDVLVILPERPEHVAPIRRPRPPLAAKFEPFAGPRIQFGAGGKPAGAVGDKLPDALAVMRQDHRLIAKDNFADLVAKFLDAHFHGSPPIVSPVVAQFGRGVKRLAAPMPISLISHSPKMSQ